MNRIRSSFCFALCVMPLVVFAQTYDVVVLGSSASIGHSGALGADVGYQVGSYNDLTTGRPRPALWASSPLNMIDLTPTGFISGYAYGAEGGIQGGTATKTSGYSTHAFVWSGSAASAVDVHPAGFDWSIIYGVGSGQQVGAATDSSSATHAMLWTGSAASAIDLHPSGWLTTIAYGAGGGQQVGAAAYAYGTNWRATLWTGSAASAIDLHPAASQWSFAWDTDGLQQVGSSYDGAGYQATLWSGSSASAVDLDPFNYNSEALGVSGGKQVGYMQINPIDTVATVWSGSAASYVNLHAFLPAEFQPPVGSNIVSYASGIAPDGTIAGQAFDFVSQRWVAVLWRPAIQMSFGGFLQPINDPPTPESVFKRGSTIIVQFQLRDSNGDPVVNEPATISLTKLGAVEVSVNEGDFMAPADDGVFFRVSGDRYVYNLSTRNLQVGCRYRVTATYGTASNSTTFAVR